MRELQLISRQQAYATMLSFDAFPLTWAYRLRRREFVEPCTLSYALVLEHSLSELLFRSKSGGDDGDRESLSERHQTYKHSDPPEAPDEPDKSCESSPPNKRTWVIQQIVDDFPRVFIPRHIFVPPKERSILDSLPYRKIRRVLWYGNDGRILEKIRLDTASNDCHNFDAEWSEFTAHRFSNRV